MTISQRTVKKYGIPTKKLKIPYDCHNADGSENTGGKITSKVSLKIKFKGHPWMIVEALVIKLWSHNMLLGHNWLSKHNPTINWNEGIVTYKDCPPECTRTFQINAAESTEVTKPPDYVKPYMHLFKKKEFDKLPLHRDWDHEINLMNDTLKDLPAKVYPMTQTELQTLNEFLEEGL
ncbi:hypothetical protein AX17_005920 [Amanita inopinata Kibby_2008]|nr:hypothetical protein AX17_005920 [Amanita inopinata Kibby_2008]